MATQIRERVIALLEPVVNELGYELVEVESVAGPEGGTLRLYIDRAAAEQADGDGGEGIGIDDCERVSRAVAAVLDEDDPLPGAYSLEVSSPGFDRVLRTPAHFARFVGARVKLELLVPRAGRKRFTGVLRTAQGASLVLEVDGVEVKFAFAEIARARVVPE
ncbi:MAG: ribosome maturation factor RimP [Steroidobacteraceae bacterium]